MRNIVLIPRRMIIRLIKLYQATLSPDHGPAKELHPYGYCRHTPTCSMYAIQVIQNRGVLVGGAKTLWRLLHCTPFHSPSRDKIIEVTRKASGYRK